MKRSYWLLFALVLAVAVVLAALGRPRTRPQAPAAPAHDVPVVELALEIRDGHMTPEAAAVPKGSRVRLKIDYRGDHPAQLALAGYEDRLVIPALAPGSEWSGEFLADRPGDEFAWLLNGEPSGRLAVTGSHLEDGHR